MGGFFGISGAGLGSEDFLYHVDINVIGLVNSVPSFIL
ncbi:hypothetical protein EC23916_A0209 [Escherichia coli 2.3916]|uniref:Uncharacterized protein n=1 Tax=Escherichia coli TaxID=562 RepID=A0A2H4TKB7_ECOLX|nr:hypothetical protein CV83915_1p0121 [Escherichia coli]EII45540.1 hypothetical protein EC23916_A0209 [Escherichia coli 2.3916]QKY85705.1 hypothetical protein [Escherichia coli]